MDPTTHPACGGTRTVKHSAGRRWCKDCAKSYTPGAAPPREPSKESCPACGHGRSVRVGGGRQRLRCCGCGKTWYAGRYAPKTDAPAVRALAFTAAVNDSPVFAAGLRSLKTWLRHHNGDETGLLVAPLRYRNPTSKREGEAAEYTWAAAVQPYLTTNREKVCPGLQFLADIKTQPTAVNPLSGLDTITGADCGIVPHTKVALSTIATRGADLAKVMWTTGAITKPVYSDTKAGKKGEFHHVLGAVVVTVREDGTFAPRNIHFASDGSFIDLDKKYHGDTVSPAPRAAGLRLGDVHAEKRDPVAMAATQEMIDALQPRHVIADDILNFGSASHHNSYIERVLRRHQGKDDVWKELVETCEVIDSLWRPDTKVAIVSSNHHDHLGRWLSDPRNSDDVQNAVVYHEAKLEWVRESLKKGYPANPFAILAGRLLKNPVRFIGDWESYVVAGIENCYHGDKGPNGARGSAKAFNRIGLKTNIGHSHTPCIEGGCYQGGTLSLLNMGYNVGPSGWMHANIVTYANGKRAILFIINGKWR